MSKLTDTLKKVFADAKAAYQKEPVRITSYIVTALLAAGVPVAVVGVPLATVVGIVLGGITFTEGVRASVYSPASVQEIAAEAADAAKPKRRAVRRKARTKRKR